MRFERRSDSGTNIRPEPSEIIGRFRGEYDGIGHSGQNIASFPVSGKLVPRKGIAISDSRMKKRQALLPAEPTPILVGKSNCALLRLEPDLLGDDTGHGDLSFYLFRDILRRAAKRL